MERYQRPINFPLTVGVTRVCVAPGGLRTPVKSFLVQSDNDNAGYINIGDANTGLRNGLQLTGGQAFIFSVSEDGFFNQLSPTPMQWFDAMDQFKAMQAGLEKVNVFLDMSDFYAISNAAGQLLRVMWSTIAR
jgi:hypothetical protein